MEKLLSVVVPVYNVEKYINRCIESIVNQTYKNLEIILVDDGSPDNCPAIIDEWAAKDNRIHVIHKKNGGLSDARNKGIDVATGEYIAFVDSDDFIEPNMYEEMIKFLESTNSDIATCGRYIYNNNTRERHEEHTSSEIVVIDKTQAIGELLCGGLIEEASWDKIYKRKIFGEIRFPFGEINEDIPVMPMIFEKTDRVVYTGKPFYNYCMNNGSITRSGYSKKQSVVVNHIKDISIYIRLKYPELHKELRIFQARYTFPMMVVFAKKPVLKKEYKSDYAFYKNCFRKNWKFYFLSKYSNKKTKIEILLMRIGIYNLAWKFKNIKHNHI